MWQYGLTTSALKKWKQEDPGAHWPPSITYFASPRPLRAWLQSKTDRMWLLTSECCAHRSEPQRSQWETLKHSVFIQCPLLKAQIKCGRGGEEKDCRSQRWWWMSPSKQYLPDTTALIATWTYKDCSGMHRLEPGKISALRSESGHACGCRACIISLLSIFFLDFWLFLFVDLFDLRRRERFSFFSFCWVFCLFVFLESMDMKFSG